MQPSEIRTNEIGSMMFQVRVTVVMDHTEINSKLMFPVQADPSDEDCGSRPWIITEVMPMLLAHCPSETQARSSIESVNRCISLSILHFLIVNYIQGPYFRRKNEYPIALLSYRVLGHESINIGMVPLSLSST